MKKGDFVNKVRAKYPSYKDVPDDELFVRLSKHYPTYIQNDEELKKDFLDLANKNEDYGSDVVKLDPEKAYNLITSIPEYKPPKSEYLEFGKHDPDVDWGEAGSAAVSYLGNMGAEGFSWDEEANMAGLLPKAQRRAPEPSTVCWVNLLTPTVCSSRGRHCWVHCSTPPVEMKPVTISG